MIVNLRAARATAERPTHRLEGEIGPDTGAALAAFLEANPGPARLVINSPGGIATEGAAMAAEVERHGQVDALGQGIVASAATLPFLAAKRAVLHSAALVMIHNPQGLVIGSAVTMRKWADDLDTIGATYAAFYARQTGHPVARVHAWMRAETWLPADDALALGFADAIEERREAEPVAAFDYSRFRHPPLALLRMTVDNGWATASPDSTRDP